MTESPAPKTPAPAGPAPAGPTSEGKAAAQRGPLRARFLASLPDDPDLRALGDAFEAGNYARVREEAPRLVERSEREDVRMAARDLLARIEPDPLVKYLLVLALLLLLGVTAFAYGSHTHG